MSKCAVQLLHGAVKLALVTVAMRVSGRQGMVCMCSIIGTLRSVGWQYSGCPKEIKAVGPGSGDDRVATQRCRGGLRSKYGVTSKYAVLTENRY